MKRVFTGFVREIGDGLAIWRPDRFALIYTHRVGQVSRITLFSGNRDDIATSCKDCARTVRRNIRIVQFLGDVYEMRAQLHNVAGQAHFDWLGLTRLQIVKMKRAKLLVNNGAGTRGGRFEIQTVVLDELFHLFGTRVITEERDWSAAIGKKIYLVADPHGIEIV